MLIIISLLLLLVLIYTIVPFILSRWMGIGVYKNGGEAAAHKCQVAFTFDDGPNSKYTNELLDLLKEYHMKASFFVVGVNAEKYPDIILRMHQEGHLIGVHNYVHHSNWLMSPWKVKEGLERAASVIEGITGTKPVYYRPPWGMLNIFDLFIHKHFRITLWSLMTGDWKSKGGSKRIEHRLLKGIKPGNIVLLHDSGENWGADEDAPQNTIDALRTVLVELSSKGYHYVRLDEWI